MNITLSLLDGEYAVCKLNAMPDMAWQGAFISLTQTADEISLVCPLGSQSADCTVHAPWRAFRVAGTLDFSLTGILHGIAAVLSASHISIFAVSTYDTDYILVPSSDAGHAKAALNAAGYAVLDET